MKFLCEACDRLVVLERFAIDADGLRLTCPACGADSRSAPSTAKLAAAPAPSGELGKVVRLPAGEMVEGCPKCGTPRPPQTEACARCGLMFDLYHSDLFELPDEVEALWGGLERDFTDESRHVAFIDAAARALLLHEAARRYRLRTQAAPEDALSARYFQEVVKRLMATVVLPERPPKKEHQRRELLAAAVLLVAAIGAVVVIVSMMSGPAGP